jgi:hypothetical protein
MGAEADEPSGPLNSMLATCYLPGVHAPDRETGRDPRHTALDTSAAGNHESSATECSVAPCPVWPVDGTGVLLDPLGGSAVEVEPV